MPANQYENTTLTDGNANDQSARVLAEQNASNAVQQQAQAAQPQCSFIPPPAVLPLERSPSPHPISPRHSTLRSSAQASILQFPSPVQAA